jgi:ferredoxin
LIQELFYKIPSHKIKIPGYFKYFRYVFLSVFVVLMPLLVVDDLGLGQTWFCKLICPAGTLEAGLPLIAANSALRSQIGFLFAWKFLLLIGFVAWMIISLRPFCRSVCPLGTILGFFNKLSLFQMRVDDDKCTQCGQCTKSCPVGLEPNQTPNSPECIRCLKCLDICAYGAIDYNFLKKHRVVSPEQLNI